LRCYPALVFGKTSELHCNSENCEIELAGVSLVARSNACSKAKEDLVGDALLLLGLDDWKSDE